MEVLCNGRVGDLLAELSGMARFHQVNILRNTYIREGLNRYADWLETASGGSN